MLTLQETISYFQEHYPDEFNFVGPTEIEYILAGGEYGETKDAQFVDAWEALSHAIVVIKLLQVAYSFYQERKKEDEKLKYVQEIRAEVIQELEKKYGFSIPPSDPLISDEAIERASSCAAETEQKK